MKSELLSTAELVDPPDISADKPAIVLPPIRSIRYKPPGGWIKPREIVYGLLHQGSKMVLGGGSKTQKTFVLIDLAISVSCGAPWLSMKTSKGRVLYINFEIQECFFHEDRAEPIAEAKGVALTDDFDVWTLRGYCTDFAVLLPEVEKQIRGKDYALIIIDPLYKGLGGRKENSNDEMADLLNQIEHLAVKTGAACVVAHHFSKGNQAGKDSKDRMSGAGAIARDPDAIVIMTPHEEDNAFTVETTLRNFKPIEPFVVRWDYPLMRRDGELDPKKLKQALGRAKQYDPEDILTVLPAEGLSVTDWQEESGIKGGTFHRLRRELLSQGKIEKKGRVWIAVPKVP